MIFRAIIFFFFVCFIVWGIIFSVREFTLLPAEQAKKVAKIIGFTFIIGFIATLLVSLFVVLF